MESIKKISEYVAQLRRVGKGHGMFSASITSPFQISIQSCDMRSLLIPFSHHLYLFVLLGVWHFDQMLLHGEAVAA